MAFSLRRKWYWMLHTIFVEMPKFVLIYLVFKTAFFLGDDVAQSVWDFMQKKLTKDAPPKVSGT